MEISRKLTIFLKVISIITLTGCCTPDSNSISITPFPPRNKVVKYTSKPVVDYIKSNKTFIVTSEFMNNAIDNQIFVEEILKWKRDNGIR